MLSHSLINDFFSFWPNMFLAFKERCFAKRLIKSLIESYSAVSAEKPDLSDKALYREVLLHTQQVDESSVDQMLQQAEDSIDEWTSPGRDKLGFREVVHFFILAQYTTAGHKGTIISLREIVNSLVPANL